MAAPLKLGFMIGISMAILLQLAIPRHAQVAASHDMVTRKSGSPATPSVNETETKLFSDRFESGDWSAWQGADFAQMHVTAALAASGTHSAVTTHVAGTGSTAWAEAYFGDLTNRAPQVSEVTQEFDSYFDRGATIRVSNGGGTKITILICNEDWKSKYPEPLSFSPFYLTMYADPNFNLRAELHRKTGTPDVWQDFRQNLGTTNPIALGDWQHIKVHAKLNTPGKSDGVLQVWLNGVQTMNYSDVDFRDSYTIRGWNMFEITGYDNAPSSNTWNQYWDNISIYAP